MKSSAKLKRKFFGSEELTTSVPGEDLDRRIARALRYMASQATWDQDEINRSVEEDSVRELSRETAAKALDYVAAQGIDIRKGRMMDLGAGLGMISEEAAVRGANPVAVEPGSGFREIALARIRRAGGGTLVSAIGESLPFPDNSFDFIISMEVLEHVVDPPAVLGEIWRVLKPGGWCYFTCGNYLSFWEGHYSVAWFPLLPKPLGAVYLRLRGKRPEFLMTSITYTTLPGIRRELWKLGFRSTTVMELYRLCRSPQLIKTPWKRALVVGGQRVMSTGAVVRALEWIDTTHCLFSLGVTELIQKPQQRSEEAR